ncbi:hypothetical protein Q8F55_008105 [Vanrija albida]|uniref:Chromatin assembly factor 1 subunit A n=1 Tax=Vanrija albida TaxID=181172 RepID=A0ABR3PVE0_9TREE
MAKPEVIDLSFSSPPRRTGSSAPSSAVKRKSNADNAVAGSSSEKKARAESVVELNGRKLIFHQEPYQRNNNLFRRKRNNFEDKIMDAKDAGKKLDEIPEELYDAVVMAGHELTSSSDALFVKHLAAELTKGDDDLLDAEILTPLVPKLFKLTNYGFQPEDFGVTPSKFAVGLQIRCWEAKELDKYFPEDRLPELRARQQVRQQAREQCDRFIAPVDEAGRAEILKGEVVDKMDKRHVSRDSSDFASPVKGTDRGKSRERSSSVLSSAPSSGSPVKKMTTVAEETKKTKEDRDAEKESKKQRDAEKEAKKAEREEEKKKRDEEKKKREAEREEKKLEREAEKKEREAQREAKRLELEEKKAQKEREEEKKLEIKAKQAQLFGGFFKAKPSKPTTPASRNSSEGSSSSKTENDFHRTFKPFVQRPNVEWAPINGFAQSSVSSSSKGAAVSQWSARDFLDDHLARHKLKRTTPRSNIPRGLRTAAPFGSVGDIWAAKEEASDPRSVLAQLQNEDRFPWKTLAFDQQVRPPYSGTFTKPSLVVGPRTPFAQDPIFDYSYDSGDDWQDDEGGDDVDDAGEGAVDDGELSSDEDDGEFDDWLDDEDDIVFQDNEVDAPAVSPKRAASPTLNVLQPKRPRTLVPKRVTKLQPTWVGPVWEERIAEPVEATETYRIQLLNDTPASIDPFTYESSDPAQFFKTTFSDTAIGMHTKVRCMLSAEEVAPPKPTAPKPAAAAAATPLGDASATVNAGGKAGRVPKIAFPAAHVAELLNLVDGSSKILSDLISSLKSHFDSTTKAAIEAKIREVAVRDGKGKDSQWRVKAEAWAAEGLTPPVRGIAAALAGTS